MLAQALEYIKQHTDGGLVGPILWDSSFKAIDDGDAVAAIFTSEPQPGTPLFFDIYTHPDYRGRRLATALIQRAMERLRDGRGFKRVTLRVALVLGAGAAERRGNAPPPADRTCSWCNAPAPP